MNSLQKLKQMIYENNDIEKLLLELECDFIKQEQNGDLYTAMLPEAFDSSNKRSVQVKNSPQLYGNIRSRGISGDIYHIVGYIKFGAETEDEQKENLYQIKHWILNALEYDDIKEQKQKRATNEWLKKIKSRRNKRLQSFQHRENKPISEKVLNDYFDYASQEWVDEGITIDTQDKFDIRLCSESQRIIIPIHDKDGNLIGTKGRTVIENYKDREIPKYLYLYRVDKSIELFNYHRAKEHIKEKKRVIVFESEKSVMLADQYGYPESVAISGDALSPFQVKLLKDLGIDIDIILAYDKDKERKHMIDECKQFKNRDVYVLFDLNDDLEGKDSPPDKGKEVFDYIFENKKKYKGGN